MKTGSYFSAVADLHYPDRTTFLSNFMRPPFWRTAKSWVWL